MSSSEGYQMSSQDYKDNKTNINTQYIDADLESESIEGVKIPNVSEDYVSSGSKWKDFVDSFKRVEVPDLDPNLTEQEKIAIVTARTPLKHHLKSRHLQMIAIGGAIGTGLFVGSGTALRTAGPASLIIGWAITGSMIYSMVMAIAEMAVLYPISGGFTTYATRFIDESFGFANNFNYMLQWLVVLPLEIVSASITVNYWNTPTKYRDGFVALFWLVIVIINLFGVKGYGEAEFIFSFIKVITVVGFIILGVILICGGGPTGGYIGAKYWYDPGAFVGETHGAQFQGFCSVFVTAAFSFAGSELIGIAGSEAENPRKAVPSAAKQVFWRILLFYILCLLMIGLLVPSNDPRLIGASSVDAAASPFVIAITTHGIKGLPSVINVVILIAVLSVGNSAIYTASRTLVALSEQGFLPKIVQYIDRSGRPLVGIGISSFFGLIAFVAASEKEGDVFNWLLAISGLSSFFTWGAICLCHIRFRAALSAQNRSTDELPFVSPLGTYGSYWGIFLIFLMLAAQFYVAIFPVGDSPSAANFFSAYLALPVVIVFYFAHKIYTKNWKLYIPASEVDLDTGRREVDLDVLRQEVAEERRILAAKPWWYRAYVFWCA